MDLYDPAPAQILLSRHDELQYPYECNFGGARLQISKGVFCPTLTNASPLLLSAVNFEPGQRVLDVFSGSGAFAVVAALCGAEAVAVDISPLAAECAITNVALNRVESKVEVRSGTLEVCVSSDERFDVIVANPPLLPGCWAGLDGDLVESIYDPEFRATLSFFSEVGCRLDRCGSCYVITSDVFDRAGYDVDRLSFDGGLAAALVAERDAGYETYRVHELRHRT
jgi:hypothetical protein